MISGFSGTQLGEVIDWRRSPTNQQHSVSTTCEPVWQFTVVEFWWWGWWNKIHYLHRCPRDDRPNRKSHSCCVQTISLWHHSHVHTACREIRYQQGRSNNSFDFQEEKGMWMSMNQWKRSMETPVISSRYPCLFPCPIVGVCFHWVASTQCQQNLEFTGPNKSRVRYSRSSRFSHSAGRFQWSLAWRASLTEMFPGMSDFWLNSGLVQNSYNTGKWNWSAGCPKDFPVHIFQFRFILMCAYSFFCQAGSSFSITWPRYFVLLYNAVQLYSTTSIKIMFPDSIRRGSSVTLAWLDSYSLDAWHTCN